MEWESVQQSNFKFQLLDKRKYCSHCLVQVWFSAAIFSRFCWQQFSSNWIPRTLNQTETQSGGYKNAPEKLLRLSIRPACPYRLSPPHPPANPLSIVSWNLERRDFQLSFLRWELGSTFLIPSMQNLSWVLSAMWRSLFHLETMITGKENTVNNCQFPFFLIYLITPGVWLGSVSKTPWAVEWVCFLFYYYFCLD